MIRVAFIGCGRIAGLHAAGYCGNPSARLVAVCDRNIETARRRCREWEAEAAVSDYRRVLEDPGVDAVEILTPQPLHEEMVVAAAAAGKHIAVQKPMTISLDSAARMTEAVEKAGIVFKVTDNYLFYPPLVKAKSLMEDGIIGEPVMLRMKFLGGAWTGGWTVPESTWGWRVREAEAGRGLQTFDHGHHMWATAWYLMGEVEKTAAWIDHSAIPGAPVPVDCPAVIMWKHRSAKRYGICDYTHASGLEIPADYYACDEYFEITGTHGMICVRRCTGKLRPGPALRVCTSSGWRDIETPSDWALGFRGAMQNFHDAVRQEAAPLLSAEEACHILRFAFAIRRASDERREVALSEITP
jgi:predicted dehydrogenase